MKVLAATFTSFTPQSRPEANQRIKTNSNRKPCESEDKRTQSQPNYKPSKSEAKQKKFQILIVVRTK